ncbi:MULTISPECIES: Wzz/FepE/Etk N-terminal domain-containing protein [unclassified Pseudomonas]|uniref:Wzz/FepE/Etk N-terminal domain-containing protein n=1 Tax=unclassified Pseudomonas TaxID=196821 RepID=UPI0030D961EE
MSSPTHSNDRPNDDEIDLIPLIQALWASKITIIATTIVGAAASLALYASSPEQWTASTYITKPSLYSLYKEVNKKDAPATADPLSLETKLYSTIQNDIFYSAMGVMAANSVALKDTPPKSGGSEPVLYIASITATTAALASSQLKSAMDNANTQAIALNLPALAAGNTLKAFTTLDEIKTSTTKNTKKYAFLGAFLGLILGSVFVLGRFFIRQYKQSN